MTDEQAKTWERARRPAILADVGGVLPSVWALRSGRSLLAQALGGEGEAPPTAEERLWLDLRFADIVRRFLPQEALEVLRAVPPMSESGGFSGPAIEVAALIELGRLDDAEAKLMLTPGETGLRALLDGRLALERGRLADALRAFDQAVELANDVELRAEALCFRARTRRLGDLDATADFDALEALCAEHGAGVTISIVRFIRDASNADVLPALTGAFYRVGLTQLTAALTLGVEKDRASVEPIPLHVHGAARKHREATAYVSALLPIASLQLSVHADVEAFETAWYGFSVGQRLFGQAAVVELAAFLRGMRDGIGVEAFERIKAKVDERATAAAARRLADLASPTGGEPGAC